jgi:hypothetical protein
VETYGVMRSVNKLSWKKLLNPASNGPPMHLVVKSYRGTDWGREVNGSLQGSDNHILKTQDKIDAMQKKLYVENPGRCHTDILKNFPLPSDFLVENSMKNDSFVSTVGVITWRCRISQTISANISVMKTPAPLSAKIRNPLENALLQL